MAKKQGDEEPVESSIESANERDMEALKGAEKPTKEPAERDEPVLEFHENRPEGDDDEEPEQPRPSRQERRNNRVKELEQAKEAAERKAAAAEQVIQSLRQPPPQQRDPREDLAQYDGAIDENSRDQLDLSAFYQTRLRETNGQIPADEMQRIISKSNALKNHETALRIQRANYEQAISRPQPRQQDPYAAVLFAQYSDVMSAEDKKAYVNYLYKSNLASGQADTPQLLERILKETRDHFNGGAKAKKPTADSQSRYTGSAAGSNGSRGAQESTRATLPHGLTKKEFERMADEMYPHIKDDGKRRTKYYREVVEPMGREK